MDACEISIQKVNDWFKKHNIVARYLDPAVEGDKERDEDEDDGEGPLVQEWVLPWPEYLRAMPFMHQFPYQVELLPVDLKQMLKLSFECPIVQTQTVHDLLPEAFFQKLDTYQVEGIQYLLNRGGRGTIADEMGLGKTLQSIGLMMCVEERLKRLSEAKSAFSLAIASNAVELKSDAAASAAPAAAGKPAARLNVPVADENESSSFQPEVAKKRKATSNGPSQRLNKKPKLLEQRDKKEKKTRAELPVKKQLPLASHLIVCPATIRDNWNLEFEKHLPDYDRNQVCIITSSKHLAECLSETEQKKSNRKSKKPAPPRSIASVRFWIMSYDLLVRDEVFTLV